MLSRSRRRPDGFDHFSQCKFDLIKTRKTPITNIVLFNVRSSTSPAGGWTKSVKQVSTACCCTEWGEGGGEALTYASQKVGEKGRREGGRDEGPPKPLS